MATTRKHRLSLTCFVAALLIVAVWWWLSRPQIDPRFLGRWTVNDGQTVWPIPIFEFHSDGSATAWNPTDRRNQRYTPSPLVWFMDGNRLIWRNEDDSLIAILYLMFDRVRYRFQDRDAVAPHENVFEIVEVSTDEIQVDAIATDNTKYRWTLHRTR